MKLRPETILETIENVLQDNIAAQLEDDFAKNDIRMMTSLLANMRLFRDDEVALKIEEHDRMRKIFADACEVTDNADLARRLSVAATGSAPGLRISELDAETGQLRNLLVELHEHVEGQDGDAARRIDRDIWRMLRDVEATRAPRA